MHLGRHVVGEESSLGVEERAVESTEFGTAPGRPLRRVGDGRTWPPIALQVISPGQPKRACMVGRVLRQRSRTRGGHLDTVRCTSASSGNEPHAPACLEQSLHAVQYAAAIRSFSPPIKWFDDCEGAQYELNTGLATTEQRAAAKCTHEGAPQTLFGSSEQEGSPSRRSVAVAIRCSGPP
jgi:hypothetical protein